MLGASRAALFWDKMCVRLDESKAPLPNTGDRGPRRVPQDPLPGQGADYLIPPADAVADVDGVADRIAWPTPTWMRNGTGRSILVTQEVSDDYSNTGR